jgi:hypothetical protein
MANEEGTLILMYPDFGTEMDGFIVNMRDGMIAVLAMVFVESRSVGIGKGFV